MKVKKWTGKEYIRVDYILKVLNGAVTLDQKAITKLVNTRVPCNDRLANHATIQVSDKGNSYFAIGLLGILNGVLGIDSKHYGPITAVIDDKNKQVTKFRLTRHKKSKG